MRSFVVRHAELELIVQVVGENRGQSNQHVLVIGPRGIGKTMLVLRVVEEVRGNEDLAARWYPLVFSEESYLVRTPGEFWLEALFHLAHKTDDERWRRTYEELRDEQDEERLRERALAQLMDFADREVKRILLVVENFNMLLGEQISDSDAWKLRHALLHEPRVMLLATATSRFKEIDNADKAMFELFKLHELGPLDDEESGRLWASVTGEEPRDERVRPLQILTGGNPRLLAIISAFAAKMSLKELMDDLMQLVDDNTEYFKSHLDNLPAVERKVYLALTELWDPAPARRVADFARVNVNKASSLLRRLMERGMVVEANGERRTKVYQVSERMYNIYYLMRRRGAPSRRVRALVRFMVPFYGQEELVSLTGRIAEEACELEPELRKEHFWAYAAILESTSTETMRDRLIKASPHNFFEMEDIPASIRRFAKPEKLEAELRKLVEQGELMEQRCKFEEAEELYRKATEVAPREGAPWARLGRLLHKYLRRYEEAGNVCRRAVELDPECSMAWRDLLCLLAFHLNRMEDAVEAAFKVIELLPDSGFGWAILGHLEMSRGVYTEAEKAYRRAIELDETFAWAWGALGWLLHDKLGRYEEAEVAYRKAVEIDERLGWVWGRLGELLHQKLERYEEAEKAYRKAIPLNREESSRALGGLILVLWLELERREEALEGLREYLEKRETVKEDVNGATDMFVQLAAAGYGKEALEVLRGSASAEILEPLVVGLAMYVGEDVKVAAEIMEVGKDVVKRIEQRRKGMKAEKAGEERAGGK